MAWSHTDNHNDYEKDAPSNQRMTYNFYNLFWGQTPYTNKISPLSWIAAENFTFSTIHFKL